jgi:U3 small nucleolar ribonucleoprotein protein IMP4
MAIVIPNAERINRGSYVMQDLVSLCLSKNLTDLILLHEHRGVPDGLILCHFPVGPTVYFGLENVVLRHDVKEKIANMPEIYPHLVFHNFSTQLGDRVMHILQHIFPVAKAESKRVITFSNNNDLISFRHHSYTK